MRWEFLRNAPTQAGVSFVKYYAWVRVYAGSAIVAEGAVRVAQQDEAHYQVTDFLSVEDVRAAPASVARVFPKPLVQAILKRAGAE